MRNSWRMSGIRSMSETYWSKQDFRLICQSAFDFVIWRWMDRLERLLNVMEKRMLPKKEFWSRFRFILEWCKSKNSEHNQSSWEPKLHDYSCGLFAYAFPFSWAKIKNFVQKRPKFSFRNAGYVKHWIPSRWSIQQIKDTIYYDGLG